MVRAVGPPTVKSMLVIPSTIDGLLNVARWNCTAESAAKGVEETDVGITVTDEGAERNASTCCST